MTARSTTSALAELDAEDRNEKRLITLVAIDADHNGSEYAYDDQEPEETSVSYLRSLNNMDVLDQWYADGLIDEVEYDLVIAD